MSFLQKFISFCVIYILLLSVGCTNTKDKKNMENDQNDTISSNRLNLQNDNLVIAYYVELLDDKLTIEFKNNTEHEWIFGQQYYSMEIMKNNSWIDVPVLPNAAYEAIALTLIGNGTFTDVCNLKYSYGELENERYKLTKKMYKLTENMRMLDSEYIFVALEFEISK
jgi:hypothetical protein